MPDPRQHFPRGLIQPHHGYRFSVDSLLLACFARIKRQARVVDLGAGCGVAGLGLLLRDPEAGQRLTALDADQAMASAVTANAAALGLDDRVTALCLDVDRVADEPVLRAGSFDLALCNPPYREPGRGRATPKGEAALAARVESGPGLEGFVRAAARLVRNGGALCLVLPAERLAEALGLLAAAQLAPKRLRCVHGRAHLPAKIVLVEAVRSAGPGLRVEPPLILYEEGQGNRLTPAALAFCPFLSCNAGRTTADS